MIRVRRLPAATVEAAVAAGLGSTSAGATYVDIIGNDVEQVRATVGAILQAEPNQAKRDALDPIVRRLAVAAISNGSDKYVSPVPMKGM